LPHKEIRKEQAEMFSHKDLIVVWFYDGVNDDLIDIPFIEQHAQLMEQKEFEDGIIYYFKTGLNKATASQ
jgi:sorbitol-specific phosphotransferase system component IIA